MHDPITAPWQGSFGQDEIRRRSEAERDGMAFGSSNAVTVQPWMATERFIRGHHARRFAT
ncbi:MAG: hypothetical protein OJF47_001226 [Nitrospira sp.]|nr:MAG: hypothetical protein OJF47_001226 [Nitrospira sp.]